MKVSIVGAGGFGTALAILLAQHNEVTLFERSATIVEECRRGRNTRYEWLARFDLPNDLTVKVVPRVLPVADFAIVATSSAGIASTLERIENPTVVVLIQKGLLPKENPKPGEPSWTTPYELTKSRLPDNIPVLTFTGAAFAWNLLGPTKLKMLIGHEAEQQHQAEAFAKLFEPTVVWPVLCDSPIDAQVLGGIRVAASVAAGILTQTVGAKNQATCALGIAEIKHEASRWASSHAFAIPSSHDQIWRVFLADFLLCLCKDSRNYNLGRLIASTNLTNAQQKAQKLGTAEAIQTVGVIYDAVVAASPHANIVKRFPYLFCLHEVLSGNMTVPTAQQLILDRQYIT